MKANINEIDRIVEKKFGVEIISINHHVSIGNRKEAILKSESGRKFSVIYVDNLYDIDIESIVEI